MGRKYAYKGIQYEMTYFKYKEYRLRYDVYYEDKFYHSESDADGDIISFWAKTKREAKEKMEKWFIDVVEKNKTKEKTKEGHYIDVFLPDVLKEVKKDGIMYHISENENKESISKKGLIPRGKENPDVDRASFEMDKYKPSWIPDWVKRYDSVYFHPELSNASLIHYDQSHLSLFAVSVSDKKGWVGSQGLGGFCLFDDDETYNKSQYAKIEEEYGPLYWKNSCSLEDYIEYGKRVRKKDKQWGLDEILVGEKIPPSEIVCIGHWDDKARFIPNENFKNYVKDEYRSSYKDILEKY